MPKPSKLKIGGRLSARGPRAASAVESSSPPCYLPAFDAAAIAPAETGIGLKRIYDARDTVDGFRVLVDRLWPRGVRKDQAALDAWARELAPSTALRRWLHDDTARWSEFCARYRLELQGQTPALEGLRQRARTQWITLLYAAKDRQFNHAVVLREVLLAATPGDYRGFG